MADHIVTPDSPEWGKYGVGHRVGRFERKRGVAFDTSNLCAKVKTDRYGRIVRIDLYRRKPFEFIGQIEGGYTARKDAKRDRKVLL